MVFNPATDFLGLWRNTAGQLSKLEMPGLDYMVAALARAGLISLSVSATPPVANQSTTAWLQAAVPSYSAEGVLRLWNPVTSAYAAATPGLFLALLEASAGQNGVSWWTTTGGAPLNTVGLDGDFAIQTDEPGGVYGPKAAGAWPTVPLPGTTDIIGSTQLDATFGAAEGNMIYRDAAAWGALAIGTPDALLAAVGGIPAWETLSALLDTIFGNIQGDILYRDAAAWGALPAGAAGQVLSSGGPAANPSWAPRTAEFPSGTVMLFQQTLAPPGWTKQVALNDCALRVTSGVVSFTAGTPFSTIFAQTSVGNTTLSVGQIPAHTHGYQITTYANITGGGAFPAGAGNAGASTDSGTGGGGSHTHSINLSLAYVDVIIASKD